MKAWPSPNTYTAEAHASQVSHSSVYFGDSCRPARGGAGRCGAARRRSGCQTRGPTLAAKAGVQAACVPDSTPRGWSWLLAALSQQGSAGQGGAATHPAMAADAERQGPVGGAPCGGSGTHGTTLEGLAAAPLPRVALRGALKFLMKLCEGKGRRLETSPQDQMEGGCCSPGGRAGVRPPGAVALTSAAAAAPAAGCTPCRRRW